MNPFEVNARIIYALRTCGLVYAALEKLCCIMNMPKTMTVTNFDKITNKIRNSAKVVAEISMNNDAAELKKGSQGIVDIGVTVDGTWQRRAYTSMNGVPQMFEEWKKIHQEPNKVNYSGTAQAMEVEGAKRMFECSIVKRNLRYTSYYGDGDSKAYEAVKYTYEVEKPVQRFECIWHYQKRVVCRLRKLKKNIKGLKNLTPPLIDVTKLFWDCSSC